MKSFSQSGQDLFVNAILKSKRNGTFLDIGCNHPVELSNTYALETELEWKGLLVDRDEHCVELCKAGRSSLCLRLDALTVEWDALLQRVANFSVIDYLTLDCDENSFPALRRLLETGLVRFRVLTVETDCYRFGPGPRDAIDGRLEKHGYDILCRNVRASDGSIYETWCVSPKLVDMKNAEKFRSNGEIWSNILKKGD